jgi:hypothetical protein
MCVNLSIFFLFFSVYIFGSIDWSLVVVIFFCLITTTIHSSLFFTVWLDWCDERIIGTDVDDDETIKDMKYDFFSSSFFLFFCSLLLFFICDFVVSWIVKKNHLLHPVTENLILLRSLSFVNKANCIYMRVVYTRSDFSYTYKSTNNACIRASIHMNVRLCLVMWKACKNEYSKNTELFSFSFH